MLTKETWRRVIECKWRKSQFWATGSASLRELANEVFGKAHLKAGGSDFEPLTNFKERDLIQTLLEQ